MDHPAHALGNYFFAPALIGPLESAYCVAHKFMWLNSAGSGTVAQLFGSRLRATQLPMTVSRSFLSNWWVKDRQRVSPFAGAVPCAGELRPLFLNALCDAWGDPLGDSNLRFCPKCLEHGYHSFIFQIAALAKCPLHDCELTNQCPGCGGLMSPFSLSRQTFQRACGCTKCQFDWAPASERISAWFEAKHFHAAFRQAAERVVAWLDRVRQVPLPFSRDGEQSLSYTGLSLNERAYLCARASVGPCPFEVCTPSEKVWMPRVRTQDRRGPDQYPSEAYLLDLSRAYRAVRRQIERRALVQHRPWISAFRSVIVVKDSLEPGPEGQFPCIVGAYAVWRSRVEAPRVGSNRAADAFFSPEVILELQLAEASVEEATYLLLGYFYGLCAIVARAHIIKSEALSFSEPAGIQSYHGISAYAVYQFRVLDGFRRDVIPFMRFQLNPPCHHLRAAQLDKGRSEPVAYVVPSRHWEDRLTKGSISGADSKRMLATFRAS